MYFIDYVKPPHVQRLQLYGKKKREKRKELRDLRMVGGAAFALALGLPLIYPVKKRGGKRAAY